MADKALDKAVGHDSQTYDHKWGFVDTRFEILPDRSVIMTGDRYALSGKEMPEFIPFVEEMLDIRLDLEDIKPERQDKPVPEPNLNQAFCQALEANFTPDQFTVEPRQRLLHSHGQTTADEVYKVIYGELERVADMVIFPESEADCEKLVALAVEHDVCLVPSGGRTSVSCALLLPTEERRMIVVVNMRRMKRILWLDRENLRACVEAGITGQELERALAEEGFVSGHEPDSVELSTLGGWIATNASGMKKNRYGNIEDIVENVTLVTPQGLVEQAYAMPRISIGMQPQRLLFGSEGNLGLITKAVLRIHPRPEVTRYGSVVFPDFQTGVAFLYELNQAGVLPASVRLVDNVQFRFGSALKPRPTRKDSLINAIQKFYLLRVKGFDPHELSAATIVMEGSAAEVAYQERAVYRLARKHRGIPGGETNGKRGYMLTYAIAYIRDFLSDYHIIGETYETTVPWSRIMPVIDAVAAQVAHKHQEYNLPGRPYISPRITQLYQTGVCIYFTHGFSTKGVENPDRVFSAIERSLRQTILDAGGSISHHHGVGKLRQEFMAQTLSPTSVALLKELKKSADPKNIFGVRNNVFAGE